MNKTDIKNMKVDQLKALAEKWEVVIPDDAKKADVVKLLGTELEKRNNKEKVDATHIPDKEFGNLETGESESPTSEVSIDEILGKAVKEDEGKPDENIGSNDPVSEIVVNVTELEEDFFNFVQSHLQVYGDEEFSDLDVKDVAKGLGIYNPSAKGVLGSLVKKGLLYTYNMENGDGGYDAIFIENEYKNKKITRGNNPSTVDESAASEDKGEEVGETEFDQSVSIHVVDFSSVPTTMVPVAELTPSKMNFFKPLSQAKYAELRESIVNNGLLNPIIVRPNKDGKVDGKAFEILAGENRYNVFVELGKNEIPARIVDVSDDKAKEILVDTNVAQRGELTPMEVAKAYHEKKLIIGNRQGQRSDLKGDELSGATRDIIAQEYGKSGMTIDRYLRLVNLLPEFQEKIDKGTIPVKAGMELGLLDLKTQEQVLKYNKYGDENISTKNISSIKKALSDKRKAEQSKPENKDKKDLKVVLTRDEVEGVLNEGREKTDSPKAFKFTVEVPIGFDAETQEFIKDNLVDDNLFLLNLIKDYVHGTLVHSKKNGQ
ncbi:ParB/RepB/Spo0J family partition protein [Paenibacillus chitinolyticus]|uniref:ParB/RepB/Spo0J family partition protein n=1 Tax=Paenibacillus chitinolyticus TaxID=79263 RepID=UPI003D02FF32